MRILLCTLTTLFLACNSSEDTSSPPPTPTPTGSEQSAAAAHFSSIRENILKPRCFGCHTGAGGGVDHADFSTYQSTMQTVTPHDLNRSPLYSEVFTKKMPPSPSAPLSAAEIEAIRQWVLDGAPQN